MKNRKPLPPTYFMTSLVLLIGLHFLWPIAHLITSPYRWVGLIPIVLGGWLNLAADSHFKKAQTPVKPGEKSTALVESGPFVFSRHPMYLGMTAILLGGAIVLGSLIAFVVPVAFAVTMQVVFINNEERTMEETFGETYRDYKKRVRRWL